MFIMINASFYMLDAFPDLTFLFIGLGTTLQYMGGGCMETKHILGTQLRTNLGPSGLGAQ